MTQYILIDSLNMYFRSIYTGTGRDLDSRIGMSLMIMMNIIKKCYIDFKGDHIILCCDGKSWRKSIYEPYKANRKLARAKLSPKEKEDQEVLMEAFNEMLDFFKEKTNCTILEHGAVEADDLIALWIEKHPHDKHLIVSSDSDFYQLLASNVEQYKGTTDELITIDGILDSKTKEKIKDIGEPSWLLFEKCVRGDSADNIFSAYPGARVKGTKNKTGIREAYEDRIDRGYNYNNFMNQKWIDIDEKEHIVKNDFERNSELIDLTRQPDIIKEACYEVFDEAKRKPKVVNIGFHFLKFCASWELKSLSNSPHSFVNILNNHITQETK